MKILMVCLGNNCRSPLAEGIMKDKVSQAGLDWFVDSAGTSGWHAGELPDSRSIQVARQRGIDITDQRSRQQVVVTSQILGCTVDHQIEAMLYGTHVDRRGKGTVDGRDNATLSAQACPACYCFECVAEQLDPQWMGIAIDLPEKRFFHIMRAYHLAGRCSGCNACEEACPMDIPISLLNRKIAQEVEALFDYRVGQDATTPPPLATFQKEEELPM